MPMYYCGFSNTQKLAAQNITLQIANIRRITASNVCT